jgi:hypothetical protein
MDTNWPTQAAKGRRFPSYTAQDFLDYCCGSAIWPRGGTHEVFRITPAPSVKHSIAQGWVTLP